MGQRNQGIFSIEKKCEIDYDINKIIYFNRLTALIRINACVQRRSMRTLKINAH